MIPVYILNQDIVVKERELFVKNQDEALLIRSIKGKLMMKNS